jgi:menaquinone-specific isochorismate synthase
MHPFEIDGRTYFLNQFAQDLPALDLVLWLENHPLYPKIFWKDRDSSVTRAAVGSLFSFTHIPHFSSDLPFALRLYGGMRFSEKHPKIDTIWHGFPKVSFWLPQVELSQRGDKTEAIFHFFNKNPHLEVGCFEVGSSSKPSKTYALLSRQEMPTFAIWKKNVDAALKAISSGNLEKIVLARRTSLQFSRPISVWHCLSHLMKKAKHATLFAFQLSPSLCFLGATPEKLFQRTSHLLSTDVLAGTRPRGVTPEEDMQFEQDLLNNPKEQYEFNTVKDFLQTAISPFSEGMKWAGHDHILKASHVQHIHNRLNVTLRKNIFDQELVGALHPTPALGGFPQKKAVSFLKEIEQFDRGWYGGPIGVISPEKASLYVAIRSALIQDCSLHLFAGAGIVKGSIAECEWEELEQKIRPFIELFL